MKAEIFYLPTPKYQTRFALATSQLAFAKSRNAHMLVLRTDCTGRMHD